MKKLLGISLISVVLDRIIKMMIVSLGFGNSITVIKGFFNITCMYNDGAAWSMLSGYRILLIIISIAELIVLYFVFIKGKKLKTIEIIIMGMLIGGIVGNLIDRIVYGYVIDYLDFNIFGYNFPIFNLADSLIVISVGLLVYAMCKGDIDVSK